MIRTELWTCFLIGTIGGAVLGYIVKISTEKELEEDGIIAEYEERRFRR